MPLGSLVVILPVVVKPEPPWDVRVVCEGDRERARRMAGSSFISCTENIKERRNMTVGRKYGSYQENEELMELRNVPQLRVVTSYVILHLGSILSLIGSYHRVPYVS